MRRTPLFTLVLVLGLLVSKASFAQFEHAYSPTPPAEIPRPPTAPERVYPEHTPGTPVPRGYHLESHVRMAPLVTGSILGGLSYSLALLLSFGKCPTDRWMLVPVAGPLAAMATQPHYDYEPQPCDDPEGFIQALRVYSAIGQGVGGWLILYGVARPKSYVVPNDAHSDARASSPRTLAIVPALTPSTASVVVLGTF